jgi:lipid II:glycine glycyltransferase (peptidoglycan interpeptide bridge formation enzyme)
MDKEIKKKDRKRFDGQIDHPLQSWAWGELRRSSRVEVVRLGRYRKGKLGSGYQMTLHDIPFLPWKIGYCPKSRMLDKKMLTSLQREAKRRGVIMVKLEPEIRKNKKSEILIKRLKQNFGLVKGKALFTQFTFWLDLTNDETELMAGMKAKTRYNIGLAKRKGVKIVEDSSDKGFEDYWKLMKETTDRQSFYAHNKEYHLKMWNEMRKAKQAYLFKAVYKNKPLATWIVFVVNGVMYYPYGASSREHRNLMANNLLAWEVIRFGKRQGLKRFDMWGSLGNDPDRNDPWYGFHKFKEGYGGELVEFIGSWDLVVRPFLYWLYRAGEVFRWIILRILKQWRT